jgi:hypothetical protein
MTAEQRRELEAAILSDKSPEAIVALLRRFKEQGASQGEVDAFLEAWRRAAPEEAKEDRVREVADFVAGVCSAHRKVGDAPEGRRPTRPPKVCAPAVSLLPIARQWQPLPPRRHPLAGWRTYNFGQCKPNNSNDLLR